MAFLWPRSLDSARQSAQEVLCSPVPNTGPKCALVPPQVLSLLFYTLICFVQIDATPSVYGLFLVMRHLQIRWNSCW